MSPLARCYCQDRPDENGAECLWPSKPCADLYFSIWQICLFLWKKKCVDAVLSTSATVSAVSWSIKNQPAPHVALSHSASARKQLANQAAGRGPNEYIVWLASRPAKRRTAALKPKRETHARNKAVLRNHDSSYDMMSSDVPVLKCKVESVTV